MIIFMIIIIMIIVTMIMYIMTIIVTRITEDNAYFINIAVIDVIIKLC